MESLKLGIVLIALTVLSGHQALLAASPTDTVLVLPNLDDDDGDGIADAVDLEINGPEDLKDLTSIRLPFPV